MTIGKRKRNKSELNVMTWTGARCVEAGFEGRNYGQSPVMKINQNED